MRMGSCAPLSARRTAMTFGADAATAFSYTKHSYLIGCAPATASRCLAFYPMRCGV